MSTCIDEEYGKQAKNYLEKNAVVNNEKGGVSVDEVLDILVKHESEIKSHVESYISGDIVSNKTYKKVKTKV